MGGCVNAVRHPGGVQACNNPPNHASKDGNSIGCHAPSLCLVSGQTGPSFGPFLRRCSVHVLPSCLLHYAGVGAFSLADDHVTAMWWAVIGHPAATVVPGQTPGTNKCRSQVTRAYISPYAIAIFGCTIGGIVTRLDAPWASNGVNTSSHSNCRVHDFLFQYQNLQTVKLDIQVRRIFKPFSI